MKLIVGFFFLTGKTFIQSGQLVIHRRTHTGELFVRSLKINFRNMVFRERAHIFGP